MAERTLQGLLTDLRRRVTALERRRPRSPRLIRTAWHPIPTTNGFRPRPGGGGPPEYCIWNNVIYFRGTIDHSSGNMPTSGQNTISNELTLLTEHGFAGDEFSVIMCAGPTGGTLMRVYLTEDNRLTYGGSSSYGNGTASYLAIGGASGAWFIGKQ